MKRPWVPVVIAVILAVGVGLVVFWYGRGAEDRALADQQPVSVLISTELIPTGTSLQEAQDQGLVDADQVPSKLQPPGAISSVNTQNASLIALSDIPAGQMLLAGDFAAALPKSSPLQVEDGMLAVSVLLETPAKVGTFLRPDSQIAIFETSAGGAVGAERETRLLLDRVSVLAIGAVTAQDESSAGSAAWEQRLVTVAVDQQQAAKLVHGIQTGALYMALLGDSTVVKPAAG